MTCPPTLFVIFNRPDTTAQVFEAIRQARPARLYVAADGPRAGTKDEAARCDEVRRIATQVDWPCELKTLFRDQNCGCRRAVSGAITWFFENENEGIILEDDCLPAPDFFPFCEELLNRYRDDKRIMAVCGSNYAPKRVPPKESYFFSYFADIWGWATWRSRWNLYDRNLTRWAEFKQNRACTALNRMPSWRLQYWGRLFDLTAQGKIDTWDYQWIFTVMESGGLACHPARNLISNLGFRPDATHTKLSPESQDLPAIASLPVGSLRFPLTHSKTVVRTEKLDRRIEAARFGIRPKPTYLKRAWNGLSRRVRRAVRTSFSYIQDRASSASRLE